MRGHIIFMQHSTKVNSRSVTIAVNEYVKSVRDDTYIPEYPVFKSTRFSYIICKSSVSRCMSTHVSVDIYPSKLPVLNMGLPRKFGANVLPFGGALLMEGMYG